MRREFGKFMHEEFTRPFAPYVFGTLFILVGLVGVDLTYQNVRIVAKSGRYIFWTFFLVLGVVINALAFYLRPSIKNE